MHRPANLDAFQAHFRAVERGLRSDLEKVRAQLHHSGNKGAGAEASFRNALGRFLPRKLTLGHGEVIDTHGNRSAQCDLVVGTDQHPNWVGAEEPSLFLVEAVAAAAEIKAVLTTVHLTTAIENTKRFRRLRPTWGGRAEVMGSEEDVNRYYRNPPYFLFAYESQLSLESIAERVASASDDQGDRHGESLDGVFVLDRGYVMHFGYGASAFVAAAATGERLKGYYYDDVEPPLLALLRWLPTALAIPLLQLPVLSQYLLSDLTPGQGSSTRAV